MSSDNIIDIKERLESPQEIYVDEMETPYDEVFIDDEHVIIRTPWNSGLAMTPKAAKELAVRLIEAACFVERG